MALYLIRISKTAEAAIAEQSKTLDLSVSQWLAHVMIVSVMPHNMAQLTELMKQYPKPPQIVVALPDADEF